VIALLLPQKARAVKRVDGRRILSAIPWGLRSGAPWHDLPKRYGSYATADNRFVR
jgi:transposase